MNTNATLTEREVEQVQDILIEQLGVQRDQLEPGARIEDDLGADSLDVIEIAMAVEELFGVDIPDEAIERVITVEDLLDTLAKHLRGPGS